MLTQLIFSFNTYLFPKSIAELETYEEKHNLYFSSMQIFVATIINWMIILFLFFPQKKNILKIFFPVDYLLTLVGMLKRIHGSKFLKDNLLYTINAIWISTVTFLLIGWTLFRIIDVIVQENYNLAKNLEQNKSR
jgi:hypothetical protein